MTAYRHEEYGTGRSHRAGIYAAIMVAAAVMGMGLALLTWA